MSDGGKRSSPPSTFHLLAGLASGFTSSILLQPADLLKTRVQQSASNSLLTALRSIAAGPSPIRQLWRGTLPSTIRTSFGSALYFAGLERLRRTLAGFDGCRADGGRGRMAADVTPTSALPKLTTPANLVSGAVARATVGTIMMPVTVLKVRYESTLYSSSYSTLGLLGSARSIARTEGLRGFFAGAGATAVRDAPYAGLYVAFYEWGKKGLAGLVVNVPSEGDIQEVKQSATSSASINFTSGALAATLATAATNPPDAVKTRLQLYPGKYRNGVQAVKVMLREEGWRSLFDGLGLRVARKALSSALAWTVYEELVRRAEARLVA